MSEQKLKTWPEFSAEMKAAGKTPAEISVEWKAYKEANMPPKIENTPPPSDEGDVPPPEKLRSTTEEVPVADAKEEDYLRQYQYKKQAAFGSVASNPSVGTKAFEMKKKLLMQPRVMLMIPREMSEDPSIKQSVTLNGYRLDLPKQTYIEVPKQVFEVLKESLNQTEAALSRGRIDGNDKKEAALL